MFVFKGYLTRSRALYKAGKECNIENIIFHAGPHSFSIVFDNTTVKLYIYGLWQLKSEKGNVILILVLFSVFPPTVVPCILILSKFLFTN